MRRRSTSASRQLNSKPSIDGLQNIPAQSRRDLKQSGRSSLNTLQRADTYARGETSGHPRRQLREGSIGDLSVNRCGLGPPATTTEERPEGGQDANATSGLIALAIPLQEA